MADVSKAVGILFKAQDSGAAAVIDRVRSSLGELNTSAKASETSFAKLGTEQGVSAEAMRRLQLQTASLQIQTAKLTGDTDLLARGQALLGKNFAYTGSEEERLLLVQGKLKAENDLLAAKAKQAGNALEEQGASAGRASGGMDKLATAARALAASFVLKAFVDANVEFEKFQRAMTLLTGSTEAASAEFDYISRVARTLGLDLWSTADAYVQLAAATKGTALQGDQTREIFEAVSKAMSSLGKSSADAQGALLAISQMVSKGTVSMEELRGQLGERLPGAFQIAAKSMGLTTQELDKLVSSGKLSAEEFLPKFAAGLRETFGDTTAVEGFAASMNNMKTAISEAFIELGKTGAFDAMTKAVQIATAAIVGAVEGVKLLGTIYGTFAAAVVTMDFSDFGATVDAAMQKAADGTRGARDAMLGYREEAARTGAATADAMGTTNQSAADTARLLRQNTTASDSLAASLKTLGIQPEQIEEPLSEIITAFENLAANPAVNGGQILAGLKSALKSSETTGDIERLSGALTKAFVNGRLSADEFGQASVLLGERQDKMSAALARAGGAAKSQADELRQQARETERAEQAAKQYALELEKLASNERIKLIEARVQLNVAQVQADTERIKAAFESIHSVIDSTGDVIGDALGALKDVVPNTDNFRLIQDQLDKENELRREAFTLQKQLTEAQVEHLRAQTEAMLKGEALIKIDGANLQPHLEAFMWEILRTIQTRVNRDGLAMLLGGF